MIYKSNVGVVSRSRLPQQTFIWCVPDLFSSKTENREHTVITSRCFSYDCCEWHFALIVSTPESRFYSAEIDKIDFASADCMGLFLWQSNPVKMQYNISLSMRINLLNTTQSSIFKKFSNIISGQLDSRGSFGTYRFLRIEILTTLRSAFSPYGLMKFTCKIEKVEIPETVLSVLEEREIRVEDKTLEESEESSNENSTSEISELKGVDRLTENFKVLCLDGHHNDFVLRVDGREFPVHRGILGARSPVFAAMFEHDMVEKKEDGVDIPDCVAPAFEIFLLYIYTGHAENLSQDNVFDVYYAADKYKVDDLKAECVEFMKSNLSVSTFCSVIALSERHEEKILLKVATCFFKENIKEIIKTVHWKKYLTENPISANELLIKALDN